MKEAYKWQTVGVHAFFWSLAGEKQRVIIYEGLIYTEEVLCVLSDGSLGRIPRGLLNQNPPLEQLALAAVTRETNP